MLRVGVVEMEMIQRRCSYGCCIHCEHQRDEIWERMSYHFVEEIMRLCERVKLLELATGLGMRFWKPAIN